MDEEECHFCDEILGDILSRLPRKDLCRFNCISKRWCNLIADPKMVFPRISCTGLVLQSFQLGHLPSLITFLDLDNKGRAASTSFNHPTDPAIGRDSIIVDSCNRFLVFLSQNLFGVNDYLVYNPTTGCLAQNISHFPLFSLRVGLVLDDDSNHFRVISAAVFDSYIWFYVFSSNEGRWRAKKLDSSPVYSSFPHQFSQPVKSLFFKGAIHLPLPKHLLIFQLQDKFCKLIESPIANSCTSTKEEDQFIWEFEGCLHYCQVSGGSKIDIWVLHMEEDNYVVGNQQIFDWQQKHSVVLLPRSSVTECTHQLSPFAFNGDFQILYLLCPGSVFSHNIATRKQEAAYACAWEWKEFPSFYPSIKYVRYPFSLH